MRKNYFSTEEFLSSLKLHLSRLERSAPWGQNQRVPTDGATASSPGPLNFLLLVTRETPLFTTGVGKKLSVSAQRTLDLSRSLTTTSLVILGPRLSSQRFIYGACKVCINNFCNANITLFLDKYLSSLFWLFYVTSYTILCCSLSDRPHETNASHSRKVLFQLWECWSWTPPGPSPSSVPFSLPFLRSNGMEIFSSCIIVV